MNKLTNFGAELFKVNECAICLEPYNDAPAHVTKCGHIFHEACLKDLPNPNCPECRTIITKENPKNYSFMKVLEVAYSILEVAQIELKQKEDEIAALKSQIAQGPMSEETILKLVREQIETENALKASSLAASAAARIEFKTFLEMADKTKVWNEIAVINSRKTTNGGLSTWAEYTPTIKARTRIGRDAAQNLLLAVQNDKVIGYAAFYTLNDDIPSTQKNKLPNQNTVLCSWAAIDPQYQDTAVEFDMKCEILKRYKAFVGSFKRDNESSRQILERFDDAGYNVTQVDAGLNIQYCISK